MTPANSILDKLMESKEKQQAAQFNATELIASLFKSLSSKESDILSRRFGLLGKPKETLEEIGKYYEITRERIRQIETVTIKKLKELKDFRQQVESAERHIIHLLENHGGIMEENHLLEEINYAEAEREKHEQASRFILNHLLNEKINPVKSDPELLNGWKLPVISLALVKETVGELISLIETEKRLLNLEDILESLEKRDFYRSNKQQLMALRLGDSEAKLEQELDKVINSYMKISKRIDQNILGEWGMANWNIVKPKRMSDKIYLILRKTEKPLHFNEITELINESNFDSKKAYPATIHNELILDDRFVLVGRGIYALKEWGYNPGTVLDIIFDILKKTDRPMSKDEIVDEVLKQRIVKKSTIYLALTNKVKIKRTDDNRFTLNENA